MQKGRDFPAQNTFRGRSRLQCNFDSVPIWTHTTQSQSGAAQHIKEREQNNTEWPGMKMY